MAFRVIKKIIKYVLILLIGFSLTSCTINRSNTVVNQYYYDQSSNAQVNEIYEILDKYYYQELPLVLSKIDTVEELMSFVDPYTYIFEAGSRAIEKDDTYEGLGITITDHKEGLLITDINYGVDLDDKLFAGDIITKVNDYPLKNKSFNTKTANLKGDLDEEFVLTISRLGKTLEVEVRIVQVPYNSIVYEKRDNVGVIKINRFATKTSTYFNNALAELESSIDVLIIDVRDNGGGYLSSVEYILENFVTGEDPYIYLQYVKSDRVTGSYPKANTVAKPYPIVVLMNQNSASASEILAGTMQLYGYPLFGEKSYGKDVFQVSAELKTFPKDTYLNFTQGYWYLKNKKTVQGGLIPDVYHIETGVKSLSYPYLEKEYSLGEANLAIATFQYIVARSISYVYEPGLFDLAFQGALLEYQELNSLTQSGKLDEETLIFLIKEYRNLIKDSTNDNLLNQAVIYSQGLVG